MGESEALLLARICVSCMKTKIGSCILLHSRLARNFHFSSVLHNLCPLYKVVFFYAISLFRLANEIGSKFFSLFFLNRVLLKISPSGERYGDVGFTGRLILIHCRCLDWLRFSTAVAESGCLLIGPLCGFDHYMETFRPNVACLTR